jgi:glycosyltransferase involved in cell wall biosynthesis
MTFTVILCTHNRCETLAKAMHSIAIQALPQSVVWEVLVVDNNSTDRTREVVEEFCIREPGRFRYLFESRQGLSNARNAGIRNARGDIIAFMDDDATVEPTWLENLLTAFQDDECAGVGGRVLPEWTTSPPRWLPVGSRHSLAPLVLFDLGTERHELKEAPFGANMAYRKAMFDKYGSFRTDLGRQPGTLISGEDSEFGDRLLAAGEHLRYEPSAVVHHPVQQDRLTKKYFLAWWFGKGRTQIRGYGIPPGTITFLGIPLYLYRRVMVWTIRWMVAVNSSKRFDCKRKVWAMAGMVIECRQLSFKEEPKRECDARS